MKHLLLLSLLIIFFTSCDPQRLCNEPKCLYTDVNTEIDAVLEGKLDSIINVNDTIILEVNLPDTIQSNYGEIILGELLQGSFFGLQVSSGDSLDLGWINPTVIPSVFIDFDKTAPNFNQFAPRWNRQSGNFKCLIIPNQKGKCIIELNSGTINLKAVDGKEWKINVSINLLNERRYSQYLRWMPMAQREQSLVEVQKKKAWYCFEVK